MNVLLANKIRMSQVFEGLKVAPVTVLDASSFVVADERSDKVMLGLGKSKNAGKALKGQFKKLGYAPAFVREYAIENNTFGFDNLAEGDIVKIIGLSKGKGFAGVIRRYNMQGGPKTHGATDKTRSVGSIGSKTIGRVPLGKRMAGRKGQDRVTIKGLRVIKIDLEKKQIILKGSIPGAKNAPVIIVK